MDFKASHDSGILTRAHVVPFGVFMAFILLLPLVNSLFQWDHPAAPWWKQDPALWVYPIQSLCSLILLIWYWRCFAFNWSLKWSAIAVIFGVVGIGFWLLPTHLHSVLGIDGKPEGILKWLGVMPREDGFNPGIFENPAAYWASLIMRFIRAVVVVAMVEEIFWRGFAMRLALDWDEDSWRQPFGKGSWLSYWVVTLLFMLAHQPVDWAGAFFYGSLTYVLCIWSRNLGACVVMHAVANLLMGIYIMATGKSGLW